jgi:hypothetical protein
LRPFGILTNESRKRHDETNIEDYVGKREARFEIYYWWYFWILKDIIKNSV